MGPKRPEGVNHAIYATDACFLQLKLGDQADFQLVVGSRRLGGFDGDSVSVLNATDPW